MYTKVKNSHEIAAMRQSGRQLAIVLDYLKGVLEPGMSTKELADLAADKLRSLGGKPAFLGYQGFPDVLCISLNDEVVHGIPRRDRIIQNGDLVSLDFGVAVERMITDAAISVVAGTTDNTNLTTLLRVTEQYIMDVIKQLIVGFLVVTVVIELE
jgi:methionyl aminopeptidase